MSTTSLFTRLMLASGAVLALAVVLLTVTPVTIDAPIKLDQFLVLLVGWAGMLGIQLLLLRRLLSPLRRLTTLMRTIDPDVPGRRLTEVPSQEAEVAELADAFNRMLDRLERERRDSARRALSAQEGERARVARELHDEIGQTLTAVAIEAERAADDADGGSREALEHVADSVRASLDDVRRIARRLRPEALDDLGLVNALMALCSRNTGHGVRIERQFSADLPPLDRETELVVYRVAQESLTNVIRHAQAATVAVSLEPARDHVRLRVTDDGRGMPDDLPDRGAGISGMRERARLVDGRFTIGPGPEGGTEVVLDVPLRGGEA